MTETSRVDHDLWRRCVVHDPRIRQNTFAVGMAFAMFGDYRDGSDVYPSMATIAEIVGLSNATKVHPHRRKLVECGYLTDSGARSGADTVVYCLTAPVEVIAAVKAGPEAGKRRKPVDSVRPADAVPAAVDQPLTVPTGPIELTLDQKTWFLGESDPESWPWREVPYASWPFEERTKSQALYRALYRIPAYLVDSTVTSTWGSGIEQQNKWFVDQTLMPWIVRIEQAVSTFLLPAGQYIRFNVDARLRAKTKDRYEAYFVAINNGFMSRDEVRVLEDLPPLPEGQGAGFVQPLNMAAIGQQTAV